MSLSINALQKCYCSLRDRIKALEDKTDSDNQTLSISNCDLTISNGNTVDLSSCGGNVALDVTTCNPVCYTSPQRGFRGQYFPPIGGTWVDALPADRTEAGITAPCDGCVSVAFRPPSFYTILRRTRLYALLDVELRVNGILVENEPVADYVYEDERQDTNPDVIPPLQYQFRHPSPVYFSRNLSAGDTVDVRWNVRVRTVGDQTSRYARILFYSSHASYTFIPRPIVTDVEVA